LCYNNCVSFVGKYFPLGNLSLLENIMIIGTTRELKNHEYRVGLTPDNVMAYVAAGHTVYVETMAGEGAGFPDEEYVAAGATILSTPDEVYTIADMIVKVKEPEECEYDKLREGQILYTYLHLAPNPGLAEALMKKNVKAVAFETITDEQGNLPCLRPMSQIAGRLSFRKAPSTLNAATVAAASFWAVFPGWNGAKSSLLVVVLPVHTPQRPLSVLMPR